MKAHSQPKIKFAITIACPNCGSLFFEDHWKAPSDKYDHLALCEKCGFTTCFRAISIEKELIEVKNKSNLDIGRKEGMK